VSTSWRFPRTRFWGAVSLSSAVAFTACDPGNVTNSEPRFEPGGIVQIINGAPGAVRVMVDGR
jgi:hypothetical protein